LVRGQALPLVLGLLLKLRGLALRRELRWLAGRGLLCVALLRSELRWLPLRSERGLLWVLRLSERGLLWVLRLSERGLLWRLLLGISLRGLWLIRVPVLVLHRFGLVLVLGGPVTGPYSYL
jgi:hypothetical protein